MLTLFWQLFLSFILITVISFLSLTTRSAFTTNTPLELLRSSYPYLILLFIFEAILAFAISKICQNPLKEIRRYLSNPHKSESRVRSFINRADEVGALASAIIKSTTQSNAMIADLTAQQRYLASILENLNDGICIVDKDGFVQILNQTAQRMFAIPQSFVSGQPLIETIRHFRVQELWQNCKEKGLQQTVQLETSPERNFLQCIATPLDPADEGNILILFQDITRLHQLEVIRRDFVSNVSHELRTPLTSLKLITETLSDGAIDDPAVQKRFLQQMVKEIDNLAQLVQELLELSRIESGLVPLQKKYVKSCALIENATKRMQMQAERAGLTFTWDCSPELPDILMDIDRLEQVLINLIHNAIKFTPPGGKIHVSAKQKDNGIVFSVQDSGVGIPPKDLDRIFERFYKADRSRSQSGTGLGLSIARHLVEAHRGKIWVDSAVNQGSTFYFSIPINQ